MKHEDGSEKMQSAEDLKKKEKARQQKELARLLEPEFKPQRVLVVGDQGLAAALRAHKTQAWGLGAEDAEPAGEDWLAAGYTLPASWPDSYDLVVIQGGDEAVFHQGKAIFLFQSFFG